MSQAQLIVDLDIDEILQGTQDIFRFRADNHTILLTEVLMVVGDLAYVKDSEGTKWAPGSLFGTYYPAGVYVYDGVDWVSDRNAIVDQLEKSRAISSVNDPTVTDDLSTGLHQVGQSWVNTNTGDVFAARSLSVGAAIWVQ